MLLLAATESGTSLTSEQDGWVQGNTTSQLLNSYSQEPSSSYGAKPKQKPVTLTRGTVSVRTTIVKGTTFKILSHPFYSFYQ